MSSLSITLIGLFLLRFNHQCFFSSRSVRCWILIISFLFGLRGIGDGILDYYKIKGLIKLCAIRSLHFGQQISGLVFFTLQKLGTWCVRDTFWPKIAWKSEKGLKLILFYLLRTKIDHFHFEGLNFHICNMRGTICAILPYFYIRTNTKKNTIS
mgnify:CR=1 FL=1